MNDFRWQVIYRYPVKLETGLGEPSLWQSSRIEKPAGELFLQLDKSPKSGETEETRANLSTPYAEYET